MLSRVGTLVGTYLILSIIMKAPFLLYVGHVYAMI